MQSCGQEVGDSSLSHEPFPHVLINVEVESVGPVELQPAIPMVSMVAVKIWNHRSKFIRYLISSSGFIVARAKTLLEGGIGGG